ncbi:hypothetical protein LEMA_P000920.1 [Plenodomus lingam JN3]|uniref:Neutral/alkaline non-lysosomal ceramidase C-terminal domain-containing protein n=2 Tax=Leptosphaeria maculans TaxID=5022 RepID=E5ADL6_LEPMJ|nr:hypothetical protein LEMA_P000920.1 [Plenodomus lingam JN3]CBY01305.1 hypothetical protein LEMA_P000920.1 [Plenodomus lingam JN3]
MRTDADWELVFHWKRVNGLLGTSEALIEWDSAGLGGAEAGTYRLRYYGDSRAVGGKVSAFQGASAPFRLL